MEGMEAPSAMEEALFIEDNVMNLMDDGDDNEPVDQQLLALYENATPDIEQYLSSTDYSNDPPKDLMQEKFEPLERHNEIIAKAHGKQHKIQYTLLKQYRHEVTKLMAKVKDASVEDKQKLNSELATTHTRIQKYLVSRNLPHTWATLLGTPSPPQDFDPSVSSTWDAQYNAFPRYNNPNMIFIAWMGSKVFVMTPGIRSPNPRPGRSYLKARA